jgi:hypothetical protein
MLFMVLMLMLAAGQVARPDAARAVTLKVPNRLPQGGSAWLEVALGVVERGAEVEVTTAAGRTISVISPYGVQSGHEAGTYTVPLPPDAISHDHISLLIWLRREGKPPRAPTMSEVKSVRISITPAEP